MKKNVVLPIVVLFMLAFLFVGYELAADRYFPYRNIMNEVKLRSDEPILAVYDPDSIFPLSQVNSLEHLVLTIKTASDWEKFDTELLDNLDPEIPVLLTLEFWGRGVLNKTADGAYDQKLKDLLPSLIADRQNIYLRWNPEMEVPDSGYPWGNRSWIYRKAFERFIKICKETVPHARVVWAPAGYAGLMENHPQETSFDVASITINSKAEEKAGLTKDKPIPAQLKRKLHRMRFVEEPILILGSKNLDLHEFKASWITDISHDLQKEKEEINFINIPEKPADPPPQREGEIEIGFYDPNELLINDRAVTVEHVFIDFGQIEDNSFSRKIQEVLSRNHDIIITVEPWGGTVDPAGNILAQISKGKYNKLLEQFYSELPKNDHLIYLRFAHEMEIPITRYLWQSQDPVEYIKAYRYFMQFPDEGDFPNIKKVWGPAGDRGLLEWWPGEDVVDIVSIAIYGLPDKNITDPEEQESFKKIYDRKKNRINLLDKPLFITEFGVKGDEGFQTRWLTEAAEVIRAEPGIIGVSYFNREDVAKAWGDIKPPEWSISKETFHSFLDALGPVAISAGELQ